MIHVNDTVEHTFYEVKGTVKDIRNNEYGYNYLVEWVTPQRDVRQDWYQEQVLVKL